MINVVGKTFGTILVILVSLIIIGILMVFIVTRMNDSYKEELKKELRGVNLKSPKALVVYQPSRSNASEDVANKLAEGLNSEGYNVTITYPSKSMNADLSMFKVISFGSPVFL